MTSKLLKQIPRSGETSGQADPKAWAKFFSPDSDWYWYPIECDGEDWCYGLVFGHCEEFGVFSLRELAALRSRWGLPIERDLYFEPRPISQIQAEHHRREGGERR